MKIKITKMRVNNLTFLCSLLFFFAFLLSANGQEDNLVDSLKRELIKLPEDSTKALLYDEICWQLLSQDPEEALKYADSTIFLAKKIHFKRGIISGNSNRGGFYYMTGDFKKAMWFYEQSDSLSRVYNYAKGITSANSNIANILYQQGHFLKALERHDVSMEIALEKKDTIGMIKAYTNRSAVYNGMGDFESMIKSLLKSLALLKSQKQEIRLLGIIENNLCACFIETGSYRKSIKHCKKAIHILKEEKVFSLLPSTLFNLGSAYTELGKRDSAFVVLKEGLWYEPQEKPLYYGYSHLGKWFFLESEIDSSLHYQQLAYNLAKKLDIKHEIFTSAISIGQCYWKKDEYKLAYQFFKEGIKGLESLPGSQIQLSNGYKEYLILKSKLGYKISEEEMERYIELRDSIFSEKKLVLIEEIETKYQLRQKQDSISIYQQKEVATRIIAEKRKVVNYFSWGLLTLSLLLVFIFYKNFKKEQKISALLDEKNSKLQTINTQLAIDVEEARKKENPFEVLKNSLLYLANKSKTEIKLSNILYLEAKDGKVFIHTHGGDVFYDWHQTLDSFSKILPNELFIQIHRAYIINIYHMDKKPNGVLVMSNGITLKISRSYKEKVEKSLSKFKLGKV